MSYNSAATLGIPSTQLGVLVSKTGTKLATLPIPSPGPKEVLIQNVAVASNPKDWKVPGRFDEYEFVEGNDVAGHIVKVGEGVEEYKGGERVAAFTKMGQKDNKWGAYQQYSVALASDTFPIPQSTTFEEASTLPLAVMTAAIGLFKRLALPEPPSPTASSTTTSNSKTGEQLAIIVNGASSSVGAYVVQLAKRAGLFVVGVAGSSKDYATSLGADVVVDYRDHKGDDLESALVSALSGHPCSHAYDAVTLNGSSVLLARVLAKTSPTGKGKVTFVLGLTEDEVKQLPEGVTAERTGVNTAYGEDEEFAARFFRQISVWLEESPSNPIPFQTNRAKVLPDGLASVEKGLSLLKNGEVHAEKLVYRIAETPGIAA